MAAHRHGEEEQRPWDDLPPDVLLTVAYAASYPSASLYAAVGHVCGSWRTAIASSPPPGAFPCRLPVLALPPLPATSSGRYGITAFPENWGHVPYGIPRVVETANAAAAVGSSHGWLILLDPDAAHLALRNPATGNAIQLPSLWPLLAASSSSPVQPPPPPDTAAVDVQVHRVIISHDPASHADFVVLLFLAGDTTRCFTFRGGANAWAVHPHREFRVEDVVLFSGRFVAVDQQNNLALFDWYSEHGGGGGRLVMTTRRLEPRMYGPDPRMLGPRRRKPVVCFGTVMLVDLSGSLLVATVWRDCSSLLKPPEVVATRRSLQILEVDFSCDSGDGAALPAIERVDLGGHAVFLGYGNSVAVAGAHFPELGTDVLFFPMLSRMYTNNRRRTNGAIGIYPYNLVAYKHSGTIIPVEFRESLEDRKDPPPGLWSETAPGRPLWVVPNLLV